jgi:putative methionine-R-sulfoxide reductase with GAF domain
LLLKSGGGYLRRVERDYSAFARTPWPAGREAAMRMFCDVGWEAFSTQSVSWIGFYVRQSPGSQELILAARRNKPACSPIGLHGACGRTLLARQPLVVTDVAHLGTGYIACDPRDQSEVVLPLIDGTGECWGVLDVDSFEVGAFSIRDAIGFNNALMAAKLQFRPFALADITVA